MDKEPPGRRKEIIMLEKIIAIILAIITAVILAACSGVGRDGESGAASAGESTVIASANTSENASADASNAASSALSTEAGDDEDGDASGDSDVPSAAAGSALASIGLFTSRDMEQSADTGDAVGISLTSGEDVTVTGAGVYVISGTATDVTVIVDAGDEDKVQLVLDGVSVTNADFPAIYVKNADKVFITTTDSENVLTVTGAFTADGTTNTDAVIFSRDDLVINGVGTLTVSSTANGITSKDDLKITGSTLSVSSVEDAIEANDSIRIAGGDITLNSRKDGLHAENDEDNALGYVYIGGGTLSISATDDGIHATTIAQIDDGDVTVSAAEGIEATWVQINGGNLDVTASDDGINGSQKSTAYAVKVEINGGYTKITMGAGDTDGIDANGDIYINGGTVDVTGQSPFDYDGKAEHNGGTIIVNGSETDEITNQFGGMGGFGAGPGGGMGGMGPGGGFGGGGFGGGRP